MDTTDMNTPTPIYPMRPVNGGKLPTCPPKMGRWAYEPKWDGRRILLHLPTMTMWNRKGGQLPHYIQQQYFHTADKLRRIVADGVMANRASRLGLPDYLEWLDLEGLGRVERSWFPGCMILLDLPMHGGDYVDRRIVINDVFVELDTVRETYDGTQHSSEPFILPTYDEGSTDLSQFWVDNLQHPLIEGFVAKRLDSKYVPLTHPDRKSMTWVKHRYV